ncbi:hypothetical protein [Pseudomonas sp. KK4]|uniref:hypothetical protein n=1 Tax=Pseudomonas sp. KK4 TaxID=1855729 RepID=UPI00111548D2|nr:hypothetical protein [Pseudomonas sp. KK4]
MTHQSMQAPTAITKSKSADGLNFSARVRSIAGKLSGQAYRAGCTLLIYTAFTNLICNKEITYGRDK